MESMPARAVSMSFRPCPVTVTEIVSPGSTSPDSTAAISPATPAADAGSTKTPSRELSSRCAAKICSSETASIRPWESSRADSASSQEAGLPMRMAEATVSGFATGSPSTSGAAPAAWNPNIRGRVGTMPAAA